MFVPNIKLNFGGIVGAVGCLIGAVALMFVLNFPNFGRTLVVLAAAAGAALGNSIWSLALPRDHE